MIREEHRLHPPPRTCLGAQAAPKMSPFGPPPATIPPPSLHCAPYTPRHTGVANATLHLMWAFNFFLIILGTCIAGNLFTIVSSIAEHGLCELLALLSDAVPTTATYFME